MQTSWVGNKPGTFKNQHKGSMAEGEWTKGMWAAGGDEDGEMARRVGPGYINHHR